MPHQRVRLHSEAVRELARALEATVARAAAALTVAAAVSPLTAQAWRLMWRGGW